jgi:molybdopterin-containing oxidoreductase family iron-sulfur binding subunit
MSEELSGAGFHERRWGMIVDLDRCTGCGACVAACKVENNIPEVSPREAQMGRVMHWIRVARREEAEGERASVSHYPALCYHCETAPCTFVCPVHATYKGIDGLVGQIYARCIGCRYCMAACPYTAKVFNWSAPRWEENLRTHTNPDVSLRPMGVVEKCTFCSHRLQRARDDAACEGREVTEGDYQPACVEVCPAKAMTFGDLEDEESPVATAARSPRARQLLEELGTHPAIYYLTRRERRA